MPGAATDHHLDRDEAAAIVDCRASVISMLRGYGAEMADGLEREPYDAASALAARVRSGEPVVMTVDGRPAAGLVPVGGTARRWLPRAELVRRLRTSAADPGLRGDLGRLAGETTDDLPPLA